MRIRTSMTGGEPVVLYIRRSEHILDYFPEALMVTSEGSRSSNRTSCHLTLSLSQNSCPWGVAIQPNDPESQLSGEAPSRKNLLICGSPARVLYSAFRYCASALFADRKLKKSAISTQILTLVMTFLFMLLLLV